MNPFDRRAARRGALIRKCVRWGALALLIIALALTARFLSYRSLLPAVEIAARAEGEFRIHFLAAGQGDCTIVEFPDGELLVVDAGRGSFAEENYLLRYIKGLRPKEISLIATHADADHFGGFTELLALYRVKKVYLPLLDAETSEYRRFLNAVARERCETETLARYSLIAHDSGAYLACVSPLSDGETDENDASAVLYLSCGGVNVLLCGDISAAVERKLAREYALAEGIFDCGGYPVRLEETDILKVAHHGSGYSSCKEWLDLLGAKTAVVSCGKGNAYSHPASGAIARLAASGAEIFRTDELNAVRVTVKDGNYRIDTE